MSTNVETLLARLEVQQSKFERALAKAARTTDQRSREIENRFKRMNTTASAQMATLGTRAVEFAKGFGAGFLGAAGISRLATSVRGAVSELSALGKAARDTGVPVEDLQGLLRGFERSTRVSADEATAAFERFNRRIGEAANGGGPFATTIERYGIALRDSNGRLRSQSELLRDVAEAIRRAKNEQERAAIAQAAFGNVGPKMAQAMAEGAAFFDRMTEDARRAGNVIEENLIRRAEILDDKFDQLTRSAGTFFKSVVVGTLMGGVQTELDQMQRLLGSVENVKELLGDDLFQSMMTGSDDFKELSSLVGAVSMDFQMLSSQARGAANVVAQVANEIAVAGFRESAVELAKLSTEMIKLASSFNQGKIGAQEFSDKVDDTITKVNGLLSEIENLDATTLERIKTQFDGLTAGIRQALINARALRAEAADDPVLGSDGGVVVRTPDRNTPRPRPAPNDIDFGLPPLPRASSGSGSSGGGAPRDGLAEAVAAIRERTAAYEAEAVAILAAAAAGRGHGDVILFVQKRAELLNAALRDGTAITPELEASVDRLAEAYVRAGQKAEEAADAMRKVQADSQRGIDAMTDLFMSITQGGDAAKRALAQLLVQMAQVQMKRAMMAAADSGAGGIFRVIGGLLGFDKGGYTGDGGTHEPKGVVHGGEYVFSKRATNKLGVGNLEALHRQAKGFATGGYVGPRMPIAPSVAPGALAGARMGAAAAKPATIDLRVSVDESGNLQAFVEKVSGDTSVRVVREYDRSLLPGRVSAISRDPRKKG